MTAPFKRPKLTTQQVGAAGEHFVAAEMHRRGSYAMTFSGNMHEIDLLASDAAHDHLISIQVKTKTAGTWQTTTERGERGRSRTRDEVRGLVDLGKEYPEFEPSRV